jgi:SM-20-related protein
MGLRNVLGPLSEQSIPDDTLLTSRERELLSNILREIKSSGTGPDTEKTLTAILARAVGETLMRRASEVAGRDVLRGIESQLAEREFDGASEKVFLASPPPPATGPRPPSPSGPGPGRPTMTEHGLNEQKVFMSSPPPPATGPRPPSPSGPGPRLDRDVAMMSHSNSAGVADDSQVLRAECVVFEEFLAPEELKTLTQYALGREGDFRISEVLSPGVMGTVVDAEHRRSRVLMDLGNYERLFRDRIEAALPRVLEKLGMQKFPITRFESQLTASNDGDFFRHHFDNAEEEIASRQLTYVYFFHREPKAFQGGELRLHDAERRDGSWVTAGSYKAVVPEQNQIVFFPSSLLHEITPVVCPSRAFADSRFTVNGWLHR